MSSADNSRDATTGRSPRMEYLMTLLGPLLALFCVVGFFVVADLLFADGTFTTFRNFRTVTVQTCVVAVAALGMTVIIIAGGIDLSAGTALALCATMLAWGLREDLGFLMVHGNNFVGASKQLELAQRDLGNARRGGKQAEIEPAQAAADAARESLRQIVEAKLAAAKTAAEAHRAVADQGQTARLKQRQLERDVELLEQKLAQLKQDDFQLLVNRDWLEGVSNAPSTAALAVLLGIATGLLTGFANGFLISYLRVVPFIITLGTMTIFLGLGNLISGNVPIRPALDQVPDWLSGLVSNKEDALYLGFPSGVWMALLLSIALAALLRYAVFGRYIFALGSNESTARLCGINVTWTKIGLYTLAGLFVGVAGVFNFSRLSTGNPMSGIGMELQIIAAVVIGGGSLNGGRGTVLGTLAGAAIMAVIASGSTQLGLANPIYRIILGLIIIGAVTIDQLRQRRLSSS